MICGVDIIEFGLHGQLHMAPMPVVCEKTLSCRSGSWCLVITFATLTLSMIHFVWPPMLIALTTFSNFIWALKSSQKKFKTKLMQNFVGQTRCIMGIAIVASVFFCDNAYICNCSKLNAVKFNLKLLKQQGATVLLAAFWHVFDGVWPASILAAACKESSVW